MNCKVCKKTFMPDELTDGICDDCMSNHKFSAHYEENNIASILKTISIASFVLSLIVFIIIGFSITSESLLTGFVVFLVGTVSFGFICLLIRGLSEIIQLLEDIKNK